MEILNMHDLCKTYGKGEARVDALKMCLFRWKRRVCRCIRRIRLWQEYLAELYRSIGRSIFWSYFSGRTRSVFHERGTAHDFRRRNIGFIFQSFQLVSELNVEQNIMFPLLPDYRKPDSTVISNLLDLLGWIYS